jgi:hypothetical protein
MLFIEKAQKPTIEKETPTTAILFTQSVDSE